MRVVVALKSRHRAPERDRNARGGCAGPETYESKPKSKKSRENPYPFSEEAAGKAVAAAEARPRTNLLASVRRECACDLARD